MFWVFILSALVALQLFSELLLRAVLIVCRLFLVLQVGRGVWHFGCCGGHHLDWDCLSGPRSHHCVWPFTSVWWDVWLV